MLREGETAFTILCDIFSSFGRPESSSRRAGPHYKARSLGTIDIENGDQIVLELHLEKMHCCFVRCKHDFCYVLHFLEIDHTCVFE